ncbi:hypothetical protein WICMUC_003531 [Wickerhamomyces mucosus]|uniref:EKC/KEOPS complex subunit BUD32 n=1 Tax=Wickerhamomyces mucosus TaxID=1378264 RepID=A0A9P8PK42_9ASCO|nr:hypothetical protein WICMUC_003531 [Wickerhamomyces mucosus]
MSDTIIENAKSHLRNIQVTVVSQGAEAIIFQTTQHPYLPSSISTSSESLKFIIKYRPPKTYRHRTLDQQLTKHRTISEARILQKLTNIAEVNAPSLIAIDSRNGILWMEHIGYELANKDISSLKNWLWQFNHDESKALTNEVQDTLRAVGRQIGELHKNDLVHGDLTSSNIILSENSKAFLIDFGLSSQSTLNEDKAVDLYVLERAILSTHPLYSYEYNKWLLEGYSSVFSGKQETKLKEILRRYEDVRLRGRKRSMLG